MTTVAMDVWLDSAGYDTKTLAVLRDNLMRAFSLPEEQANVLINGNSHRIKRSCAAEEAEKLLTQFSSWGIALRVEVLSSSDVDSTDNRPPDSETTQQVLTGSTLSLAPHGDTIPNLVRDKRPPNVVTDHLHLISE